MKNTLINVVSLFILNTALSFGLNAKQSNGSIGDDSQINLVVIDPGHGGKDEGAIYKNYYEKDIVLDIALKLGSYITSHFPETKVIYTRTKDEFVPLHERANIANQNKADLFISIHVNYIDNPGVQGTETFVLGLEEHRSKANLEVAKKENSVILLENDYTTQYEGFDPNSPESYIMFELVQDEYLDQSIMLADAIQNEFRVSEKRIDRSVKQAGFIVLWQTTMPSVLVETGFISNSTERNYLVSEAGKISIASSIFNAFKNYKNKIEKQTCFNLVTEQTITITPPQKQGLDVDTTLKNDSNENNIYFSVQIAALKNQIEINSKNFKGETKIFQLNSGKVYRYCSGKFFEYKKAAKEKQRLQEKFSGAFVVAVENGNLISVKKALRKM